MTTPTGPRHEYHFTCGSCGEWVTALIPCVQAEAALAEAVRIMRDPNAHGGCSQEEEFYWDEEVEAFLAAHGAGEERE